MTGPEGRCPPLGGPCRPRFLRVFGASFPQGWGRPGHGSRGGRVHPAVAPRKHRVPGAGAGSWLFWPGSPIPCGPCPALGRRLWVQICRLCPGTPVCSDPGQGGSPCPLPAVLVKVTAEVTGALSTGLGHRELPATLAESPQRWGWGYLDQGTVSSPWRGLSDELGGSQGSPQRGKAPKEGSAASWAPGGGLIASGTPSVSPTGLPRTVQGSGRGGESAWGLELWRHWASSWLGKDGWRGPGSCPEGAGPVLVTPDPDALCTFGAELGASPRSTWRPGALGPSTYLSALRPCGHMPPTSRASPGNRGEGPGRVGGGLEASEGLRLLVPFVDLEQRAVCARAGSVPQKPCLSVISPLWLGLVGRPGGSSADPRPPLPSGSQGPHEPG